MTTATVFINWLLLTNWLTRYWSRLHPDSSSKVNSSTAALIEESNSTTDTKSASSDLDEKSIDELIVSSNYTSDDDKIRTQCTQASISRCGVMLMKALRFLEYLPLSQASQHKCALRNVTIARLSPFSSPSDLTLLSLSPFFRHSSAVSRGTTPKQSAIRRVRWINRTNFANTSLLSCGRRGTASSFDASPVNFFHSLFTSLHCRLWRVNFSVRAKYFIDYKRDYCFAHLSSSSSSIKGMMSHASLWQREGQCLLANWVAARSRVGQLIYLFFVTVK